VPSDFFFYSSSCVKNTSVGSWGTEAGRPCLPRSCRETGTREFFFHAGHHRFVHRINMPGDQTAPRATKSAGRKNIFFPVRRVHRPCRTNESPVLSEISPVFRLMRAMPWPLCRKGYCSLWPWGTANISHSSSGGNIWAPCYATILLDFIVDTSGLQHDRPAGLFIRDRMLENLMNIDTMGVIFFTNRSAETH